MFVARICSLALATENANLPKIFPMLEKAIWQLLHVKNRGTFLSGISFLNIYGIHAVIAYHDLDCAVYVCMNHTFIATLIVSMVKFLCSLHFRL